MTGENRTHPPYVLTHMIEIGPSRKDESYILGEHAPNSTVIYDDVNDLSNHLATTLCYGSNGVYDWAGITIVLNRGHLNDVHKGERPLFSQTPQLFLGRDVANISALGSEAKLLEDIARTTHEIIREKAKQRRWAAPSHAPN